MEELTEEEHIGEVPEAVPTEEEHTGEVLTVELLMEVPEAALMEEEPT